MKRKIIVGVIIVAVLGGGLIAVKIWQIKTMIAFGAAFVPPPATVATAAANEEVWQDILPAVGSVSPAQGVTLRPKTRSCARRRRRCNWPN
jgi:membrane fusion protein (multidrug efflux system)